MHWRRRIGCLEFECAVWPLGVVMADVVADDALELSTVEDEQPVETFTADAADPALVGFEKSVMGARGSRGGLVFVDEPARISVRSMRGVGG